MLGVGIGVGAGEGSGVGVGAGVGNTNPHGARTVNNTPAMNSNVVEMYAQSHCAEQLHAEPTVPGDATQPDE
jgi:hypothetical protein